MVQTINPYLNNFIGFEIVEENVKMAQDRIFQRNGLFAQEIIAEKAI